MAHCLIFEAASIHEYLTASGRLRHIVGASEIIEALCGDTLDRTLVALRRTDEITFSRRAGGVFVAHANEAAILVDLAKAWSLLVREQVPGMPFKLALGEGLTWKDADADARRQGEGSRAASMRTFPMATPFSGRHALTDTPAIAFHGKEPVDAATLAKLRAADQRNNRLGSRFLPGCHWRDWPLDLSADEGSELSFPFLDSEQSLALVVADGNGLAQLLQRLDANAQDGDDLGYARVRREFSDQLEAATMAAAQRAVADVVLPARGETGGVLPMRPILLGGDDVAVIIRADLALSFARAFATAFEVGTRERLRGSALTASVAIIYFGRSQPIAQVQGLTYGVLKKIAKERVKEHVKKSNPAADASVPAAIAWHRLTVAEIGNVDDVAAHDWQFDTEFGRVRVAGMPYLTTAETVPGVGSLEALMKLRHTVERTPEAASHLREILGLLSSDAPAAAFRYRRWQEVSPGVVEAVQAGLVDVFPGNKPKNCDQLSSCDKLPLLLFKDAEGSWITPVGDLLALMAVEAVPQKEFAP